MENSSSTMASLLELVYKESYKIRRNPVKAKLWHNNAKKWTNL